MTAIRENLPELNTEAVISVRGLQKTYGSGEQAKRVIEDLSLEVRESEFLCIVGPSGAGKTTLLKCLAGLVERSAGSVRVLGREVADPPEHLALVFQDYSRSLLPWLTVRA